MRKLALLPFGLLALLAGCSSGDDSGTPAACLNPARTYLAALGDAPGEVRLDGTTAISDCLPADQDAGPLNQVGSTMVATATRLNRRARRDPSGTQAMQLGYLVGAVQEGAGDIHTDLVRRLDAAARFSPGGKPMSVSFERAFGRGYAAGQESG